MSAVKTIQINNISLEKISSDDLSHLTNQSKNYFNPVVLSGLVLAFIQFLDAVLTYIGVSAYGAEMERNAIITNMITAYGLTTAIFLAKSISLVTILGYVKLCLRFTWTRHILNSISFLYLVVAIAPWCYHILNLG